ncbi:unnamed protein product [Moneuplotes crassus]|uniref:Uncharacterized protein n=1 Tax=Euplotes crassus TaxID=5936 RepID=A0AAD1X8Y5_EUPCR|nr:unnamed protein product [Moneuplotes crassus]
MEKAGKQPDRKDQNNFSHYYIDFYIEQLRNSIDSERLKNDPDFFKEICHEKINIIEIKKKVDQLPSIQDQKSIINAFESAHSKLAKKKDNLNGTAKKFVSFFILWSRTEQQRINDFNKDHGHELDQYEKDVKLHKENLESMKDDEIIQEIDEIIADIIEDEVETKQQKIAQELCKSIYENCYKIQFNWDPEERRMELMFLLVGDKEEKSTIVSRVVGESEKNPVNQNLTYLINKDCEEVCFAFDPSLKMSSQKFFERTGFQHFNNLISMCNLKNIDTIIFKNFCFNDKQLDKIISLATERLVFNNCKFKEFQQHHQEEKEDKDSSIKSGSNRTDEDGEFDNIDNEECKDVHVTYFDKYLKKYYKPKEEKKEIESIEKYCKNRPLYSLSFIDCSTFGPHNECKQKTKRNYTSSPPSIQPPRSFPSSPNAFNYNPTSTSLKPTHPMTQIIHSLLHKISTEAVQNPAYKGRGLVSLTLKNLRLPDEDYEFLKQGREGDLEMFLVFDEDGARV